MNIIWRISLLLVLSLWTCKTPNSTTNIAADSKKTAIENQAKESSDEMEVPPEPIVEKTDGEPSEQTGLEARMLEEINRLRANPAGYITHVESYIARIKSGAIAADPSIEVEIEYAQTLKSALRRLNALPALKSKTDLYDVAIAHGKDLKRRNNLMRQNPHEGSDGSQPHERIEKGTGLDGGENFGTGHESPRDQIISLLVDAGVPSLGHRQNILNPDWQYAAFNYIGQIGEFDACWLQLFGADKKSRKGTSSAAAAKVDVSPQNINAVKHKVESTVFLRRPEKEMIHEINRLRSNPKAYISEVEAYITKVRNGEVFTMVDESKEIAVAQELIDELRQMEPLSILLPSRELYNVAAAHGSFLVQQGQIDRVNPHKGRDGLGAYERIKTRTNYSVGGENFVGGKTTVKESIMELLVDSGIGSKGNRGHRLALLDPTWEFIICHDLGTISTSIGVAQNDCWLQNFARK